MQAVAHDVYFGEDKAAVANATTEDPDLYCGRNATTEDPDLYCGRQPWDVTYYDPEHLEVDSIYYWRIDQVDEIDPNNPSKGGVWSFTTVTFAVPLVPQRPPGDEALLDVDRCGGPLSRAGPRQIGQRQPCVHRP